ncbi:type II toxin-antitoxin system RelE/ParE family toxin [Duganella sp. CY15W]|uniref:type II toxin-antitoxin system RelE/ParE family toxin n=1 Tax=Duganella sp. CY15W TaxID=2692172 RepID=UPI0013713FAD|nr:type II toxin-antitoxin system RelE/ParE family toxin [Duganella sp. CY15W]
MGAYSVQVTRHAAAQIQRLSVWWQQNRQSAPDAVAIELERAFALLAVRPELGAVARSARLAGVRRIHLVKIHHYLYYRTREGAVEILALWHTSRAGMPPL